MAWRGRGSYDWPASAMESSHASTTAGRQRFFRDESIFRSRPSTNLFHVATQSRPDPLHKNPHACMDRHAMEQAHTAFVEEEWDRAVKVRGCIYFGTSIPGVGQHPNPTSHHLPFNTSIEIRPSPQTQPNPSSTRSTWPRWRGQPTTRARRRPWRWHRARRPTSSWARTGRRSRSVYMCRRVCMRL